MGASLGAGMSGARTPVGASYFVHTRSEGPRSPPNRVYNGDCGGFWGGGGKKRQKGDLDPPTPFKGGVKKGKG